MDRDADLFLQLWPPHALAAERAVAPRALKHRDWRCKRILDCRTGQRGVGRGGRFFMPFPLSRWELPGWVWRQASCTEVTDTARARIRISTSSILGTIFPLVIELEKGRKHTTAVMRWALDIAVRIAVLERSDRLGGRSSSNSVHEVEISSGYSLNEPVSFDGARRSSTIC